MVSEEVKEVGKERRKEDANGGRETGDWVKGM